MKPLPNDPLAKAIAFNTANSNCFERQALLLFRERPQILYTILDTPRALRDGDS